MLLPFRLGQHDPPGFVELQCPEAFLTRQFVNERLRPAFRSIWFVGGGAVSGECLRRGLADEIRYSILPILIGDGIRFFEKLGRDVILHLAEVNAYKSGIVELRYEVRENSGQSLEIT